MPVYDTYLEQIKERLLVARYNFWSSMLTAHTVILTVVVALYQISPQGAGWQLRLAGYTACISIVLLLCCFAITKLQYEKIGQVMICCDVERPQIFESDKRRAILYHNITKIFEAVSAVGLFIAIVFMGFMIGLM